MSRNERGCAGELRIDGMDAVSTRHALERLREEFPGLAEARIRAALITEWEAYTGGMPLVVPSEVVSGAREVLGGGRFIRLPRLVDADR